MEMIYILSLIFQYYNYVLFMDIYVSRALIFYFLQSSDIWKDSDTCWIVYNSAPCNYSQCLLTNQSTILENSFKINYYNISGHQGHFI